MESVREWIESHGRTGPSILEMQNSMEMVLGYAERINAMRAEQAEVIANKLKEKYDEVLSNDAMTDLGKKIVLDHHVAGEKRLKQELDGLSKRLHDTRWLLLQAISVAKVELQKLH